MCSFSLFPSPPFLSNFPVSFHFSYALSLSPFTGTEKEREQRTTPYRFGQWMFIGWKSEVVHSTRVYNATRRASWGIKEATDGNKYGTERRAEKELGACRIDTSGVWNVRDGAPRRIKAIYSIIILLAHLLCAATLTDVSWLGERERIERLCIHLREM